MAGNGDNNTFLDISLIKLSQIQIYLFEHNLISIKKRKWIYSGLFGWLRQSQFAQLLDFPKLPRPAAAGSCQTRQRAPDNNITTTKT